ncbi:MAG: DNA adenine methylase [Candidatus Pacebacteria bacterium]|nr:DNA adenine methylase [Candidatus Paceibacterota bacterium]
MNKSSIAISLQREYGFNHILANSVASKAESKLKDCSDVDCVKNWYDENKPKPFVKWVGGKRQLLKQFKLMKLYPPDDFKSDENKYFEPFVGGGAVFFDLLPQKAILSDMNRELVITYNIIKDDVRNLIKSLKKHKYNKDYYLKLRDKDPKKLSNVDVASRFIYLNKTGFNGMYRVNNSGKFNVPFGNQKKPLICDEDNLIKVSESLRNIKIVNRDYKEVLKEAKRGDFIYFDPPYHPLNETSSFTGYTSGGFSTKDQEDLRDAYFELHKRGCFVMLSNSNTKFIKNIYSGLDEKIKIHEVDATRMINSKATGRGKIKEVLVVNY